MSTNKYQVIIAPTAFKEINKIYDYIIENLYAEKAAKDLMKQVEIELQRLKYYPKVHTEIQKFNELRRRYRRIVIKNYVILYTIDESKKIVYIAHMYYAKRNYL